MNTHSLSPRPTSLSSSSSSSLSSSGPAPGIAAAPGLGRPSLLSDRMIEVLCSIIRATGLSDSAAAARASLHPSTVSRWKREWPDLAILLRSAREEFRAAQLELILETARSGTASGWRAAAWLLERTFPEDYSPRARERAQFQERFDAACAGEEEGGALELPSGEPAATQTMPLQNVKNAGAPEESDLTVPLRPVANGHRPGQPLQNVQKSALSGRVTPPIVAIEVNEREESEARPSLARAC